MAKNESNTPVVTEEQFLTLKQAVEEYGLSMIYIRRATNTGKLPSRKVLIEGTKIERTEIARSDLEAWRASAGTHTRRTDGRNKITVYATPDEYEKLQALCKDNELECPMDYANKKTADSEAK